MTYSYKARWAVTKGRCQSMCGWFWWTQDHWIWINGELGVLDMVDYGMVIHWTTFVFQRIQFVSKNTLWPIRSVRSVAWKPIAYIDRATSSQRACKPERWLWCWRDEPFLVATIIALEPPAAEDALVEKMASWCLEIVSSQINCKLSMIRQIFKTFTCNNTYSNVRKPLVTL